MQEQGKTRRRFTPHPYARFLPALTEDEYAALRSDIAAHGILVPVIVDADGLILDGVHRTRIADELGVEVSVCQMGQASEERKMHLAVGLNMRRRHLDADRRRELVRRLADEQGLSVRKIASVTGWSKSTIDRDLRTSPFEEMIGEMTKVAADLRRRAEDTSNEFVSEIAAMFDIVRSVLGWTDGQWKRGSWPPPVVQHVELTVRMRELVWTLDGVLEVLQATDKRAFARVRERLDREERVFENFHRRWAAMSPDERQVRAECFAERVGLWDPMKQHEREAGSATPRTERP